MKSNADVLHVFARAQRRANSIRAEAVFMSLFPQIIWCAVAAAVVYFLKSSMKTATLLRLTSIDSKCNIFVCSGISIHFLLARSLAGSSAFFRYFSLLAHFLLLRIFFVFLHFLFALHRIALIFFHRFRSLHP